SGMSLFAIKSVCTQPGTLALCHVVSLAFLNCQRIIESEFRENSCDCAVENLKQQSRKRNVQALSIFMMLPCKKFALQSLSFCECDFHPKLNFHLVKKLLLRSEIHSCHCAAQFAEYSLH